MGDAHAPDEAICTRFRRPRERQRIESDGHLRDALEDTVAHVFSIARERLSLSSRGEAPVARARQVAMYLAHVAFGLSLTEVGDLFERDRSTVAHACRVIEDHREIPEFDQAMDLLEDVVCTLAKAHPQVAGEEVVS